MLPRTECTVAEIAHGTATNGSAKCAEARTTPSAEFCMPTSMLIVREVLLENPAERDRKYPKPNPSVCSKATAAMSVGPAARI
mmetsp:Transcript_4839/g.18552  ORF Transcript_4839/g.18552 Transcript_4839/m.18552 type:complete len:83 (-) Transcript_4839:988-1236(-)